MSGVRSWWEALAENRRSAVHQLRYAPGAVVQSRDDGVRLGEGRAGGARTEKSPCLDPPGRDHQLVQRAGEAPDDDRSQDRGGEDAGEAKEGDHRHRRPHPTVGRPHRLGDLHADAVEESDDRGQGSTGDGAAGGGASTLQIDHLDVLGGSREAVEGGRIDGTSRFDVVIDGETDGVSLAIEMAVGIVANHLTGGDGEVIPRTRMPATATANVASRMRRRTRLSELEAEAHAANSGDVPGGEAGSSPSLRRSPDMWTSRVLVDPNQCSSHTRSMMWLPGPRQHRPAVRARRGGRTPSPSTPAPLRLARRGGRPVRPARRPGEQHVSPAPQLSANSCEQLAQTERFVHVVVRTGVEPGRRG